MASFRRKDVDNGSAHSTDGGRAAAAVGCVSLQMTLCSVYVAAAYLLPERVDFLSEASHFATVHGLLWLIVSVLYLGIRANRPMPGASFLAYFPVTSALQEANVLVSTLMNALLLVIVGVESWLRSPQALGATFSILALVQALGAVEAGIMLIVAATCCMRHIQYVKLLGVGGSGGLRAPLRWSSEQEEEALSERGVGWGTALAGGLAPPGTPGGYAPTAPVPFLSGRAVVSLQAAVTRAEEGEQVALRRCTALSTELAKALATGPQQDASAPQADAAMLLKSTAEEFAQLTAAHREAQKKEDIQSETIAKYEAQLKQALAEVTKLRGANKELQRANDKLYATLHLEREANAQSQAAISDMRQRALANAAASGSLSMLSPGHGGSFSGVGFVTGSAAGPSSLPLGRPSSLGLGSPIARAMSTGLTSPGGLARQASRSSIHMAREGVPSAARPPLASGGGAGTPTPLPVPAHNGVTRAQETWSPTTATPARLPVAVPEGEGDGESESPLLAYNYAQE